MISTVLIVAVSAVLLFLLTIHLSTNYIRNRRVCSSREYVHRADRLIQNGWLYHHANGIFVKRLSHPSVTKQAIMTMSRRQWRRFVEKNLPIKEDGFKKEI